VINDNRPLFNSAIDSLTITHDRRIVNVPLDEIDLYLAQTQDAPPPHLLDTPDDEPSIYEAEIAAAIHHQ